MENGRAEQELGHTDRPDADDDGAVMR